MYQTKQPQGNKLKLVFVLKNHIDSTGYIGLKYLKCFTAK